MVSVKPASACSENAPVITNVFPACQIGHNTPQNPDRHSPAQTTGNNIISPPPLFRIRHLFRTDQAQTLFCHSRAGQNALLLNQGMRRNDRHRIAPPFPPAFKQQRNIECDNRRPPSAMTGKKCPLLRLYKRMHDLLQISQRLFIAKNHPAQRHPVNLSILDRIRKAIGNREHSRPLPPIQTMDRCVRIMNRHPHLPQQLAGCGFSHAD